eukprot:9168247-Pyramimonas_sp.AAC.1
MGMPRADADIGLLPKQKVVDFCADHVARLRAPLLRALEIQTKIAWGDGAETREGHRLDGARGVVVHEASQCGIGLDGALHPGVGQSAARERCIPRTVGHVLSARPVGIPTPPWRSRSRFVCVVAECARHTQ